MKAAFHTLGCKVNQYESEAMAGHFRAAGYEIVDERDFADVYIINTKTHEVYYPEGVELDEEGLRKFNRFRDMLDEDEDVQELWHNVSNA